MSHHALIDGTLRAIKGGKTIIDGTAYDIKGGKTLIDGTLYDIAFAEVIELVPSQSGSLTYSGSAKSPTWANYDSTKLQIGGTTSATNAGTYAATFTPWDGFTWADGSVSAKSVNWTIGKAAGSVSLSKTSISISGTGKTATFTVTRSGNGTISVESSSTSKVTVSLSGTTVTVKSVATGSATITVSVAEGTNHKAASKTCSVTVTTPVMYDVAFGSGCDYLDNGCLYDHNQWIEFEEGSTIAVVITGSTTSPSILKDGVSMTVRTFTATDNRSYGYGQTVTLKGCYLTVDKSYSCIMYNGVLYINEN